MSTLRRLTVLSAAAALATIASIGTSTAAGSQLNGRWAPFGRCPVDNPAMLAADGINDQATCISSSSASGVIKIGSSVVPTGKTDLQAGVITHADGTNTVIAPAEGALVADPADLPGGLLGLMCPSSVPVVSAVCGQITNSTLNRIVATVEPVGTPRDFALFAGLGEKQPIISIPVRIHLENPLIGGNCYIGTKSSPIVLHPQNQSVPDIAAESFAADGTAADTGEMARLAATGAGQEDTTFAAPGASGCGPLGLGAFNWAVNLKSDLPAASGTNALTLHNASTYLATLTDPGSTAPNQGKTFSQYWHSAVK
ncbi:hypothetical protein [Streptomyces sp. SID11385]|uniref:hypothetical protein n=1 Tax=Streptomyces sp. SID11385 TaxID=2706031 RepID=UPI0013C96439|nr:hypothetical protein [Streptomyces sp. SID11385]NEA40583.1 hypothetical protein [Streptomyces sp. SID11385]